MDRSKEQLLERFIDDLDNLRYSVHQLERSSEYRDYWRARIAAIESDFYTLLEKAKQVISECFKMQYEKI